MLIHLNSHTCSHIFKFYGAESRFRWNVPFSRAHGWISHPQGLKCYFLRSHRLFASYKRARDFIQLVSYLQINARAQYLSRLFSEIIITELSDHCLASQHYGCSSSSS